MDGRDEVRDECHSLADIQLIRFDSVLLCPKCSKILENTNTWNQLYSRSYALSDSCFKKRRLSIREIFPTISSASVLRVPRILRRPNLPSILSVSNTLRIYSVPNILNVLYVARASSAMLIDFALASSDLTFQHAGGQLQRDEPRSNKGWNWNWKRAGALRDYGRVKNRMTTEKLYLLGGRWQSACCQDKTNCKKTILRPVWGDSFALQKKHT